MTAVVELYMRLKEGMPVFPGDPELEVEEILTIEKDGFGYKVTKVPNHCGTHIDAPNHQIPGMEDKGVEFFDKPQFKLNKACLIDLSDCEDAKEFDGIKYLLKITEKHLEPYVPEMKKVGAVLIRTGYDKWFEAKKNHIAGKIPHFTKEAAGLLAKLDDINVIGVDSPTIDETGAEKPVHDAHFALTGSKMVIESMINLYKIPEEYRFNFNLESRPLIIEGATGTQIIVCAKY